MSLRYTASQTPVYTFPIYSTFLCRAHILLPDSLYTFPIYLPVQGSHPPFWRLHFLSYLIVHILLSDDSTVFHFLPFLLLTSSFKTNPFPFLPFLPHCSPLLFCFTVRLLLSCFTVRILLSCFTVHTLLSDDSISFPSFLALKFILSLSFPFWRLHFLSLLNCFTVHIFRSDGFIHFLSTLLFTSSFKTDPFCFLPYLLYSSHPPFWQLHILPFFLAMLFSSSFLTA